MSLCGCIFQKLTGTKSTILNAGHKGIIASVEVNLGVLVETSSFGDFFVWTDRVQ